MLVRFSYLSDASLMTHIPNHEHCFVFGIFDGHAGANCSAYLKKNLVAKLSQLECLFDRDSMYSLPECSINFMFNSHSLGLTEVFQILDREIRNSMSDGSTGNFRTSSDFSHSTVFLQAYLVRLCVYCEVRYWQRHLH